MVSLLGRAGVRSVLLLDCSLEGVASGPAESRRSKISAEMIPAAISSTASTRSRPIQRRRRCGAAGARCGALGPAGLATGRLGLVRCGLVRCGLVRCGLVRCGLVGPDGRPAGRTRVWILLSEAGGFTTRVGGALAVERGVGGMAAGTALVVMARCRAVVVSSSEETGWAVVAASAGSALPFTLGMG